MKPATSAEDLKVTVHSFAYRHGYPAADVLHGGGFIFDCRCVPNPGREESFRAKSGFDAEVAAYLERSDDARRFFSGVTTLLDQAVTRYLERGFTSLTVGFGCTGGQHRSVFFAERLAEHLRTRHGVSVTVEHRERGSWP